MLIRTLKVAAVVVIGLVVTVGCKPEEKKTPATAPASGTPVAGAPTPTTKPSTQPSGESLLPTSMPVVSPNSILPPMPRITPGSLPTTFPSLPPIKPTTGSTTRPAFPVIPDLNK